MSHDPAISSYGQASAAQIEFPALANAEAIPRLAAIMIQEGMDFVAERLRADSRIFEEMRGCGTLMDLALLQQRWLTEAAQDYSSAATRLFEHAMAVASPPQTSAEADALAEAKAMPRPGRTATRASDPMHPPVAAE